MSEEDRRWEPAPDCLTRWHSHHYRGFAKNQRDLFGKSGELKPLLYTVLLTGIHLLRTGDVRADLQQLGDVVSAAPAYLGELIVAETAAARRRSLPCTICWSGPG